MATSTEARGKRTQDEILAEAQRLYDDETSDDLFGWRFEVMAANLDLAHVQPFLKPDTNTRSSGVGTSKCSPYISCAGRMSGCGIPRAIG